MIGDLTINVPPEPPTPAQLAALHKINAMSLEEFDALYNGRFPTQDEDMTHPVSLQDAPNRGGLPDNPQETIPLVTCGRTEYDYIVRLQRPNGTEIEILVPIEDEARFVDVGHPSGPFGLNLVCAGHYT